RGRNDGGAAAALRRPAGDEHAPSPATTGVGGEGGVRVGGGRGEGKGLLRRKRARDSVCSPGWRRRSSIWTRPSSPGRRWWPSAGPSTGRASSRAASYFGASTPSSSTCTWGP